MEETSEELRSEVRRHHRDFDAIRMLVHQALRSGDEQSYVYALKKIRNIVG